MIRILDPKFGFLIHFGSDRIPDISDIKIQDLFQCPVDILVLDRLHFEFDSRISVDENYSDWLDIDWKGMIFGVEIQYLYLKRLVYSEIS